MSVYLEDYHITLNRELGLKDDASLMISEIYVPRNDLAEFMMDVRKVAAKENCDIVTDHPPHQRRRRELFELGEGRLRLHDLQFEGIPHAERH